MCTPLKYQFLYISSERSSSSTNTDTICQAIFMLCILYISFPFSVLVNLIIINLIVIILILIYLIVINLILIYLIFINSYLFNFYYCNSYLFLYLSSVNTETVSNILCSKNTKWEISYRKCWECATNYQIILALAVWCSLGTFLPAQN